MSPLPQLIVACLLFHAAGVWIDPDHRWWLPISLHQGADFYFTGDVVIWLTCLAAGIVLRRMIHAEDWYDVLPFAAVFCLHVQLCLPWGRVGALHELAAFLAMGGYSAFMLCSGIRTLDQQLALCGSLLVLLTATAFFSLVVFRQILVFGIVEQVLVLPAADLPILRRDERADIPESTATRRFT